MIRDSGRSMVPDLKKDQTIKTYISQRNVQLHWNYFVYFVGLLCHTTKHFPYTTDAMIKVEGKQAVPSGNQ